MASVEQTKDALEAQREVAAKVTDSALAAIDSVVALCSQTITSIGVIATIIALVGGVAIFVAARDMARKVATKRIEAYIRADEGRAAVQQAIQDEVRKELEQRYVMVVQPDAPSKPSTFPQAPGGSGDAS